MRFAAEPAFAADLVVEALLERDDVERPVVADVRDGFDLLEPAVDREEAALLVAERDAAPERALVARDAVDRPVVPERADPALAAGREARVVVDLLAAGFRAVVLDERALAVLRAEVLRLEVLRDPDLDVVVFFLAGPVEVLRCLAN